MTVYLDNSSTTRQFDEVTDLVAALSKEVYGNPYPYTSFFWQATPFADV